jgi:hypothetical protein
MMLQGTTLDRRYCRQKSQGRQFYEVLDEGSENPHFSTSDNTTLGPELVEDSKKHHWGKFTLSEELSKNPNARQQCVCAFFMNTGSLFRASPHGVYSNLTAQWELWRLQRGFYRIVQSPDPPEIYFHEKSGWPSYPHSNEMGPGFRDPSRITWEPLAMEVTIRRTQKLVGPMWDPQNISIIRVNFSNHASQHRQTHEILDKKTLE